MYMKNLTAVRLGEKIRSREISVREAVEGVYQEYLEKDRELNAYSCFPIEELKADADRVQKSIDRGEASPILAGVPIGVKDNICTQGVPTTCASKILRDFKPPFDATVVKRLKDAGMIAAGKMNMDEFAMGSTSESSCYGIVRNPWDTEHVPGGSSGGSAAAVSAGEAICALGSDTGGSIRQPASFCGVTGFKPTYGAVSRYGLIAYASSFDQIGPIARDALDCAAIMDVISGQDVMDSTSSFCVQEKSFYDSMTGDIKGMVIGLPEECFDDGVDKAVKESVEKMVKTLEDMGAKVNPLRLSFIRYAVPTYYIIATAEASSNLSRFDGIKYGYRADACATVDELMIRSRSEGFGPEVRKRILLGTFVLSSGYYDAYYNKALKMRRLIVEGFGRAFSECDAIICPTAPMTAPKIGSFSTDPMKMYLSDIFTVSVNLAGLPGLSVPCGFDGNGMPIGAQIIGAAGRDKDVLNIGHAFQMATDYHAQRPGGIE